MVHVALVVVVGYWLLYSATAPVKSIDAQTYELARLYVIRQGGLLHNRIVNPAMWMQIVFPWTFDAVHWPFVWLGAGYCLPSYGCFLGMLVITYVTVRDRFDARCALLCCLALCALPTLVYQATSTKNDLPLVFGVFCWFYSLVRFARSERSFHLFANALAIAFAGGVKTSGLQFAPLLALGSAWHLRHRGPALWRWLLFLVPSCLLLLSLETYVAAHGVYQHYLGPDGLAVLRNQDGIRGAAATLIRYVFRNVDLGIDALLQRKSGLTVAMEDLCRAILRGLGLENAGYGLGYDDQSLDFIKTGRECLDDFGPLGMLALGMLPVVLVGRSAPRACRLLAAAALAAFVLIAWTTGDMIYNNRFLLLPFALATIALTIRLYPRWMASGAFRWVSLAVLLFGAVVIPLRSYDRRPSDVWLALVDRDAAAMKFYPANIPVVQEVRRRAAACPTSRWVVTARPLAWEFAYYDVLRERAIITPPAAIDEAYLAALHRGAPDGCLYVLGLGQSVALPSLTEVVAFADAYPSQPWSRPQLCPQCVQRDPIRIYVHAARPEAGAASCACDASRS